MLLLTPFPPPSGGDSTWSVDYSEFAKKGDLKIEYINTSVIGIRSKGIEGTQSLPDELARSLRIWLNLIYKILKFNPDVIHFNTNCSPKGLLRDVATSVIIQILFKKYIIHCHCNVRDQLKESKLGIFLFRILILRAKSVILLNDDSLNFLKSISKTDSFFIPNFIANRYIIADPKIISFEIKNVIFLGHVRKSKGIIEICEVAKKNPEINFFIIGPIHNELTYFPFPDNMILKGHQQREEVIHQLDLSDLFIFPSHTEGFSIAMLEAMSRGLPILATNVGANQFMIDGEGGIIVEKGDINALCESFLKLKNSQLRKKMSQFNVRRVKEKFSEDKVIEEYYNIYSKVK
jgi:glycosyltransferase involved in cell wall biosynthesis